MKLDKLADALRSFIPDPFVIAIGLTLIAALAGVCNLALNGQVDTSMTLVESWVSGYRGSQDSKVIGGLWTLLPFAMQMCLILVTGYVVASTGPVQRLVARLAQIPRTTAQAAALISVIAMGLALLNWGLGLIAGALLAREVGIAMQQRGIRVHYPLLAAAGYTGLAVWHGGFSGSAPLKVTDLQGLTEVLGPELAKQVGALGLERTILSPRNLIVTGIVFCLVPICLALLVPRDPKTFIPAPAPPQEDDSDTEPVTGFSGWLEWSPLFSLALAGLMMLWIVPWAWNGGLLDLNPNSMNLCFLALGLVLAGSPARYMELASRAASACGGIIIQFPLYGGILGLLAAGGGISLLASVLPSTEWGLAAGTFLSAGLFNLFVPSGGGQWAVQGPIVMQAAVDGGMDPARILLALSWGDQWTNLFQPFWALPLLGITGTRAGDILGYTMLLGVVTGVVFGLGAAIG